MARSSSIAVRDESTSRRYFESGTALNRVLLESPYLARCSEDKTATRIRPRQYAIRYPYMQVNRSGMVSWLVFDLDHTNALIWEDAGLPAPNLVVRNRASGHSHLYYAITPVCTTERARAAPIEFMRAVYEAMAARLQADTQFHSGPVAKTPGHPWWQTWELHDQVYELGKLADYVELARASPWARAPDLDAVAHSRHCLLFEQLRHYAYSIVAREREQGSFEGFARLLEAFAREKNSFTKRGFSSDLSVSSIKATVKSVARWTWERYRGSADCHRGVMQLDKSLALNERQRRAAHRSNALRQHATESKIRAACRELRARGQALVQVAVAQLAGVSRQTVAAYRHLLDEAASALASAPVAEPPHTIGGTIALSVNCAVHQVSAASRGLACAKPDVEVSSPNAVDSTSLPLPWVLIRGFDEKGG